MNFKEAIEHMYNGKSITLHNTFREKVYFKLHKNKIICFTYEMVDNEYGYYLYDEHYISFDEIDSNEWEIYTHEEIHNIQGLD